MNRISSPAFMLIPDEVLGEVLAILILLGGICLVVGAKKIAASLIAMAIFLPFIMIIAEMIFTAFFNAVHPDYVQSLSWLVQGLLYLLLFSAIVGFLFGQQAWNIAKGQLLADVLRAAFRLLVSWPFLILWVGLAASIWWPSS